MRRTLLSGVQAGHLAGFLAALLAPLLVLGACSPEPPPAFKGYESKAEGLRFQPAPGWSVSEKEIEGCRFAVEASSGQNVRFQICVSPPRQEMLLTQNAFVACENVKQYIQEALKGLGPTCGPGKVGNNRAYDTLYYRLVADGGGKVRVQFVNQLFAPLPGRLVQVLAYTLGDDEKAARELFEANRDALFFMMASVWLR
ncbi:hypothetical protein [Fundidesulfovibrio soli]|uniref:hypothetical protein n=1 Tax=Fundidesulfovibrio soli TaxID=2922716 RepID=UPI001FAF45DB|nr:hypothetical protein [Fundidesulfovibrio soli]